MGEAKRITPEGRAARATAKRPQAVETTRDRQRKAVDALVHAAQHRMRGMSFEQMATVLGTTVGVFASAADSPAGSEAIVGRVGQVARDVVVQAREAS